MWAVQGPVRIRPNVAALGCLYLWLVIPGLEPRIFCMQSMSSTTKLWSHPPSFAKKYLLCPNWPRILPIQWLSFPYCIGFWAKCGSKDILGYSGNSLNNLEHFFLIQCVAHVWCGDASTSFCKPSKLTVLTVASWKVYIYIYTCTHTYT